MKFKAPVKLLASAFSLLFVLPLLIKSLDVSAEVEITKVSALTGRAFFGDIIHGTGYLDNTPYTLTFNYVDSYTNPQCGLNVDQNAIITSPANLEQFDFLLYRADLSGSLPGLTRVVIPNDLYLRFGDYARGGVAISCPLQSVQSTPNSASLYPDNYYGDFFAPRADSRVTQDLANYFATMYFTINSNYQNLMFRPIFYEFSEGGVLDSAQWYSLPVYSNNGNTVLFLIIMCPYIGSSMSGEPPAETTTSSNTSPSTNIDVNVSVYVDNSGIESQLNEYLGADDTRITTYETINLGTFPTFDYDNVTETVNISQVVSETGDGINSIWYLISGLFSSVPVLVWLVPFCIFMSIMSFVLWRKGG